MEKNAREVSKGQRQAERRGTEKWFPKRKWACRRELERSKEKGAERQENGPGWGEARDWKSREGRAGIEQVLGTKRERGLAGRGEAREEGKEGESSPGVGGAGGARKCCAVDYCVFVIWNGISCRYSIWGPWFMVPVRQGARFVCCSVDDECIAVIAAWPAFLSLCSERSLPISRQWT